MSDGRWKAFFSARLPEKTAWAFYFFLALVISLPFISMPIVNPDIFWHLSAGRMILETGSVPRSDFLSWTMRGSEWVDFEWLTQLLYYFAYSKFGNTGLYFLKILLILISLSTSAILAALFFKNPRHLLWCVPLVAASQLSSNDLRPENFSAIFFSLVLYLLERNRNTDRFKPGLTVLFFFIFALWANLHGGFPYGLLLIAAYFSGIFLNENLRFIYGETKKVSFSKSAPLAGILAAALAGTLINPYGLEIYSVILSHYRDTATIQEYITEWRPFDINFEYIWPFAALMTTAIAAFLVDFVRNRKTDFVRFFIILAFVYLCLNHMRNSLYGTAVFSFILFSSLPEKTKEARAAFIAIPLTLLLAGVYFYHSVFLYYGRFAFAKFEKTSPGLSEFLKKNKAELTGLRMYNMWAWGGWLGWELSPDYRVFVDGRYIFHPLLEETVRARAYRQSWQALEKKYGIELAIMEPHQTRVPVKHMLKNGREFIAQRPFYLVLLPKSEWAVIYFDARIVVMVKRSSVNAKWLKKNEYVYLRPNDIENLEPPLINGDISLKVIDVEISRYLMSHDWNSPASLNFYISDWRSRIKKKIAKSTALNCT